MNILYLTLFNLNKPSAGLNKIYRLREAIKHQNINFIVVGSGGTNGYWESKNNNDYHEILFNQNLFKSKKYSNFLKVISEASKFYKRHLSELVKKYEICGIIIYSPMGKVVASVSKSIKNLNVFIIADCGEYYNFSFHHLLNGVLLQQALFRYIQLKKFNGAIVPSPMWYKIASKLEIPKVLIPGLSSSSIKYRNSPSSSKKIINIVFMGRLNDRELPNVIFKALNLCIKRKLNFKFQLFGTRNEGYKEKRWIKKLKREKDLINKTKIYGFVSNKEKDKILSEADIFIMLRPKNNESAHLFPSRIPEFMLSGNPTILSNVPSLNQFFIENDGVKFISSSNNPNDLSELIISLANNPNKRFEIGQSGRKYALENFSFERMGNNLGNFLKNFNIIYKKF